MSRPSILPRVSAQRPGWDLFTILCAALILVQVMVAFRGGVAILVEEGFYAIVGLSRPDFLKGQLWQILTYPFFHGSWLHLGLNWIMIYLIGSRVVHILGTTAFAKIFFGGVLVGGALHLLLHPKLPLGAGETPAYAPLVGASAGAMALLLALTSLSPESRMWPVMISGKNLGRGLLLSTLILFGLTPGLNLPGLGNAGRWLVEHGGMMSLFEVSHICHFGGGLFGVLYVRRLLRTPVSLQELQRARKQREGMLA